MLNSSCTHITHDGRLNHSVCVRVCATTYTQYGYLQSVTTNVVIFMCMQTLPSLLF